MPICKWVGNLLKLFALKELHRDCSRKPLRSLALSIVPHESRVPNMPVDFVCSFFRAERQKGAFEIMKAKKRLSPFERLLRIIERETFNQTLELQLPRTEKINTDFVLGYRVALNYMLEQAYLIYNDRFPAEMLFMDERTEEASELLRNLLKRGS